MNPKILAFMIGFLAVSATTFSFAGDNIIRTQAPVRHTEISVPNPDVEPENPVATFSIASDALPSGEQGIAYSHDLNTRVSWSDPEAAMPITWSTMTALPSGLTLSSAGVLSGTPLNEFTGPLHLTASSGSISLSTSLDWYVYSDIGDKPAFVGVVTLYRFNNNFQNDGSFNLPLTSVGSPSFSTETPIPGEYSLVMNGATGFRNASAYAFGTSDLSFGAWVKTSGTGRNVISQNRDAQNTGQYQLFIVDGNLIYYDYPNGTTTAGIHYPITGNVWHHVAVTRKGKVINLYIDGVLVKTTTVATIASLRSDNGFAIGYDQRDNDEYFTGNMKDVFQLTRALTDREVKWLYKSGEGFPTP